MKTILCILFCIPYLHSVCGQEISTILSDTSEQRLSPEVYSEWDITVAAIAFAETKGISAYDYGKYTGGLLGSSLNEDYGFINFCQEIISKWENWRTNVDAAIFIMNQTKESLACKVSLEGLRAYFGDVEKYGVSFDEMMQCITGIYEQIAVSIGSTFHMEIEEVWTPCTATWYSTAIITVNKDDQSVLPDP